jgi:transcriptional regulator with XRE-family HTH domain
MGGDWMTEFAKFTKTLRLEYDERLGHMAKKIGVSSAFLSRVENGLAKPSKKILDGLFQSYSLNEEQKRKLKEIVEEARQKNLLAPLQLSPAKQQLVIRLAQSIEKFDEEELYEIEEIICQKEKGAN